jgi:hypothetical protein
MPTLSDPIDLNKTDEEILMDQINAENSTNLDYSDFIFSVPVPASIPLTDINTKITLTPRVTSGYIKPRDIFYKRIDLAQVFNNNDIDIIVDTEEDLSDLINQINEKYGINLRTGDYLDVAVPAIDPLNPVLNRQVVVQAHPESYLYVGTGNLILDPRVRPVDDYNYVRDTFVITDSSNPAVYENTIVSLNSVFNESAYFDFLRNTVSVDFVRIDKIIALPNRNFYLGGQFEFEAALNGDPLQPYVSSGLIIDTNGLIVEQSSTPLFGVGLNNRYGVNRNINYVYLCDPDGLISPSNSTQLYRYTLDGQRDILFDPDGLGYVPEIVRVADDGKIYTASSEYTGPLVSDPLQTAKQIRIDRLNSDGTLDLSFSTIYIRSTGISDVTPVVDILPITGGGGFVLLKPIHGISTSSDYPIINDEPMVLPTDPLDCSFNPVFRFNQDGLRVPGFSRILLNNEPSSVLINSSNLNIDDKCLSYADNKLLVLTNRRHPITGYTHKQLMCFNMNGTLLNIAPSSLAADIRWVSDVSFVRLDNGRILLAGVGQTRLPSGGWASARSLIVMYNQSGQIIETVYTPIVSGTPDPQIYDIATVELRNN